jgi:putative ABC transport system permease protein
VLLVGAGLMLKSVRAAVRTDPGFAVEGVATLSMSLEAEGYTATETHALFEELAARVARLPGVEAVSYADALPLTLAANQRRGISIPGYEPGPGEDMEFQFHAVGPGFLDALSLELIRGRDVAQSDDAAAPPVVWVNESFAQRFWPREDPVGKVVTLRGREAQVVGLMRDAMHRNLRDQERPAFFASLAQDPSTTLTLIARTAPGRAEELLSLMRDQVAQVDNRLPVTGLQTMDDAVAAILLPERIASLLLSIAGMLGMLLAAAGLYGAMTFVVSQKTREIGLRMALGAQARDVVGKVVRDGVGLSAVGAGIGLAIAALATRLVQSLLFSVSPLDVGVFSGMALAALVVAGLASWVPARRASTVDPMVALRLG